MTAILALENIQFKAFHGYYSEEQHIGGLYTVSVFIEYDIAASAAGDNLDKAINYEKVYEICQDQMAQSQKLIETVAQNMLDNIKHTYPDAISVEVYLRKLHPPIIGQVEAASIRLRA